MYDLTAYGHLVVDRIFDNFEESRTLGALGNFWEGCVLTNPNLFVNIQPTSLGEALIHVDRETCTRLGRGVLNLKTRRIETVMPSKWAHIMYLNQIKDINFIDKIDKDTIMSADVTSGKMLNLDVIKKLDYLFISDEDIHRFSTLEELAQRVKGWVILHSPAGSVCHNGTETFQTETEVVDNLNVLGAGDYFAASFIAYKLQYDKDIESCINFAHKNATKILLRGHNEK